MKLLEIQRVLNAKILVGEERLEQEAYSAFGSDFMSDVLAYVKDQSVLLTGLVNPQVIRAADMVNMTCIIFVRGKVPDQSVLDLAEARGMVVMATAERMYSACGKLYMAGLGQE